VGDTLEERTKTISCEFSTHSAIWRRVCVKWQLGFNDGKEAAIGTCSFDARVWRGSVHVP